MQANANIINWQDAYQGRIKNNASEKADQKIADLSLRLLSEVQAGKLPFINLPFREQLERDLQKIMPPLKARFKHMLLLGIGGSALGAKALQKAFYSAQDEPGHNGQSLWILDNVDAESLYAHLTKLKAQESIVVVISKSGATIETIAQYFVLQSWLKKELGTTWAEHMLPITDAKQGFLREEVKLHGLLSLEVPQNLGGRYSALSAVALVPAAFCDINYKALLDGAQSILKPIENRLELSQVLAKHPTEVLANHPSWLLAKWAYLALLQDYDELIFFNYVPKWSYFGNWFAQLWAESLGKDGKGSMPIPAVGVTDQHSLLQMFLAGKRNKTCLFLEEPGRNHPLSFASKLPEAWKFLENKAFNELLHAEAMGTKGAFAKQDIPLVNLQLSEHTEFAAGKLMALLELATLLTGWLLEINPLDQPAVEDGKQRAEALLGARAYEKYAEPVRSTAELKPISFF